MNTPGEDLVTNLEKLRVLLNQTHKRLNESGTERTAGLCRIMGCDCRYFKISLDKFMDADYMELKKLVTELYNTINLIEGEEEE